MMQQAGRGSRRKRQPKDEQGTLDPIALTLALWLGLVVGVSGLLRMANDAASDAAIAEAVAQNSPSTAGRTATDTSPFNPRLMAFGG